MRRAPTQTMPRTSVTKTLTNPIVKAAFETLHSGNADAWAALFDPDAKRCR